MGAGKHQKQQQKNRLPPFVPLLIGTLETSAWKALSHGARSLYVGLKRRYNVSNHNNGRIYLPQRIASKELSSHHNQIARWFRELEFYGFIVKTAPAYLGVEGRGKAPRWRLTELGYMRDPPTRDFLRWDGRPFEDTKAKTRAGNAARSVPETRHTDVQENRTFERKSAQESPHISKPEPMPESQHRTKLPYTVAAQRPESTSSRFSRRTLMQLTKPRRHREQLIEHSTTEAGRVRPQLLEDAE